MIKNPVYTVWLRLVSTLLIFFMLGVAMGSTPIRSMTVNTIRVLGQSAAFVVKGPALLFFHISDILGVIVTSGFWLAILGTACGSREGRTRRWFYVLYGVFVVMTIFGMAGEIVMGLISMSHAIG